MNWRRAWEDKAAGLRLSYRRYAPESRERSRIATRLAMVEDRIEAARARRAAEIKAKYPDGVVIAAGRYDDGTARHFKLVATC